MQRKDIYKILKKQDFSDTEILKHIIFANEYPKIYQIYNRLHISNLFIHPLRFKLQFTNSYMCEFSTYTDRSVD